LKTRLKDKTNPKKTGNKNMKWLPWEKVLYKAMEGGTNPVLSFVPDKKHITVLFVFLPK